MIDPRKALEIVLDQAAPLAPVRMRIEEALGLVLAEEIRAGGDHPSFDRAMMDGVAVRTSDAGKTVEVIGEIAAGQESSLEVGPGRCVEIMTGAACPRGAEAVVQAERIERRGSRVVLPETIQPEQHIARRGVECRRGERVLAPASRLTSLSIGLLAAMGRKDVSVYPRPGLGLITTGGEIAAGGCSLDKNRIQDANGPLLRSMALSAGAGTVRVEHALDALSSLNAVFDRMADRDMVVFVGGISEGRYDLVPAFLKSRGLRILCRKVRQKPGKPFLFARAPGQILFGLPGNPLAAHLCFHLYAVPAIRKILGLEPEPEMEEGLLAESLMPRGSRFCFMLARTLKKGGTIEVRPVERTSMADLIHAADADCYLHLPPGEGELAAGSKVRFSRLG